MFEIPDIEETVKDLMPDFNIDLSIPDSDELINKAILMGDRDEYVIRDKVKEMGGNTTLKRILEKLQEHEHNENIKFAVSRDISIRFKWLSKQASNNNLNIEMETYNMLRDSFMNKLAELYCNGEDINAVSKKKAADEAVASVFQKASAQPDPLTPMLAGGGALALPAFLYYLLSGEDDVFGSTLRALPFGAAGALGGYGYSNLPDELKVI